MSMIALVMAISAPTFAGGGDPYFSGTYPGTSHQGFETYRRSGELAAGIYLRVPFSGSPPRSVAKTRFGLTLGARLPSVERYDSTRTLADMPKLLDVSIGLTGKKSLRLNGISIAGTPRLYADEDGEPKKKRIWPWVVGGVVVVAVLGVVAARAAAKDAGNAAGEALADAICAVLPCKDG